jgi:hypothetical protein
MPFLSGVDNPAALTLFNGVKTPFVNSKGCLILWCNNC